MPVIISLGDSPNTLTINGVEPLPGGSAADTITMSAIVSNASIDLAAGSDKLTLGNFANVASIANVESLIGGTAADTITMSAVISNVSFDLAAGADDLTLKNGT